VRDSFATLLTVRQSDYTTIVRQHQNRWPKQTVWGYTFLPFKNSGFLSSRSGGQSEIEVEFPITGSLVSLIETAMVSNYLFQVELRQFNPPDGDALPPTSVVAASYLGQIVGASYSEAGITVSLGSTLDPVEASAPPRRFTTALVGRPPKL